MYEGIHPRLLLSNLLTTHVAMLALGPVYLVQCLCTFWPGHSPEIVEAIRKARTEGVVNAENARELLGYLARILPLIERGEYERALEGFRLAAEQLRPVGG